MKPQIAFDYRNALTNAVGSDGLDESHLDTKAGAEAVRVFRRRVAARQVGFPDLPKDIATLEAVRKFADGLRRAVDAVILIGIGGSALGAHSLDAALHGRAPFHVAVDRSRQQPRLLVLDNVDPGIVVAALGELNPKRTAVCVVTKSGSTAETIATFLIVRGWMHAALGKRARERIIAITDPHEGDLLAIARQEKYPLFAIPTNVVGRFSVFSAAGLVPAALTGIDIRRLLRGAADANERCWQDSFQTNPALASALVHHALYMKKMKTIEVVFVYSSYLLSPALWYRQLWAESLGKELDRKGRRVECGQTPVIAIGATDQHSQLQLYLEGPRDKMITLWAVERPQAEVVVPRAFSEYQSCGYLGGKKLSDLLKAERIASEAALTRAGRPNCCWTLPRLDEYTLGAFLQTLQFQTAFAGELFNVDTFEQHAVELGKKLTYALMGRKGYKHHARDLTGTA